MAGWTRHAITYRATGTYARLRQSVWLDARRMRGAITASLIATALMYLLTILAHALVAYL